MDSENIKYLIPLMGVIIGWVLSSFTNYFKSINENQKLLGKCLVQLHFLYKEQKKLKSYFEFIKNSIGITKEYEELRKQAMIRYVLNNENYKQTIEIVNDVSSLYPIIGLEIKDLIENYQFAKGVSFKTVNEDENLYIKLLSVFEACFDLNHKKLEKVIYKLAIRRGIFTWIKFKSIHKRMKISMDDLIKSNLVLDLSKEYRKIFE